MPGILKTCGLTAGVDRFFHGSPDQIQTGAKIFPIHNHHQTTFVYGPEIYEKLVPEDPRLFNITQYLTVIMLIYTSMYIYSSA